MGNRMEARTEAQTRDFSFERSLMYERQIGNKQAHPSPFFTMGQNSLAKISEEQKTRTRTLR